MNEYKEEGVCTNVKRETKYVQQRTNKQEKTRTETNEQTAIYMLRLRCSADRKEAMIWM